MKKTLLIILLPILLWQTWPHLDAWLISQTEKALWSQEQLAQAQKRTVYVLERQDWTEFPLLPSIQLIKVLSNASVPRALSLNSELEWRYVLQYQILDKEGKLLTERNYHHRTKATVYQDHHTQKMVRTVFYIDPNQQPTDGRNMLINLKDMPDAALLRFRVQSADPEVIDVAIRVYWRQTTDEYKLGYRWHRLSERQKLDLARGNIYEPDLLNEPEKRNLLQETWAVMGPLGVAGHEYQPRDIYIHKELEGDIVHLPVQGYGVFVDMRHWITLPLLEQGGRVRLQFSEALPLPGQSPAQPPVTINIKWYGRSSKERAVHSFVWDVGSNGFEHDFAGGLLEISASQPVMMRVFLKLPNKREEITPVPVHTSATLVQKNSPVEFQINHFYRHATPVRVSIRRLLDRSKEKGERGAGAKNVQKILPFTINTLPHLPCNVTYALLDANGRTQKTGTMPSTQSRSFYDRTTKQWWGALEVSEVDSYYLSVPPNIVTLRLTSPCAVLLAVYNRPPNLLRKVRIPEDYYAQDQSKRQPAWFRLRPKDYEIISQQNRTSLVMIQRRPPREEENIEILAGRYSWEDYRPIGKYRSRYILVPRNSHLPIREQALGAFYQKIKKNRAFTLQFVNARKTIQPNLIYWRSQRTPVKIRILLDGRLHYEGYLTGRRGELKLPKLTARKHTLILKTRGRGQFFINHAKPNGKQVYIKRLVHRFDSQGLQFLYEKRSEDKELISARVYLPHGTQKRLQVQVKLSAASKRSRTHTGWTFPKRHYDLRPAGEKAVMVLNTRHEFVDVGRFFVIPLQDDLPPGQYRIVLKPQQSLGAYLTLGKIMAGLEEQRKFFQETQPYEMLF